MLLGHLYGMDADYGNQIPTTFWYASSQVLSSSEVKLALQPQVHLGRSI